MGSKSFSQAIDQRVQLDSTGGGQFIGPQATVSQDQTYDIGTYKYTSGLTGPDILDLLEHQASFGRQSADASHRFAELALTNLSAAQQGRSTDFSQHIPIVIVAVIVIAIALARRRSR